MKAATALAILLAPVAAQAAVITGPSLNVASAIWVYTGVAFKAVQDTTLTSFTYQNQGQADTVMLLLENTVNPLHTVAIPGASNSHITNVNWALQSGQTYWLLTSTANNAMFANGAGLPSNADIEMTHTALFSMSIATADDQFGPTDYWAAFNDITTGEGTPGVPEPASWALMIAGFGLVGAAARRRAAITA